MKRGDRRLRDGRAVVVHQNSGLRKACACPRRAWAKCPHAWHFSFAWRGKQYRFSLDRYAGKAIGNKTEAEQLADGIRVEIRAGSFVPDRSDRIATDSEGNRLTFTAFADLWKARRGFQLVNARDNAYRLKVIQGFVLPGTAPAYTFGERALHALTVSDIEALRDSRRASGRSPVTINHDLRLLRKMFNWAVRKGYLERTPFKIGTEPAVTLEREIPRNRRLASDEDETKLLNAANPHLRAVIIAMLDTACRPGEVLSLQWQDLSLDRREITIRAEKEKTRRERIIPISSRLLAVLEMRRTDPAGRDWPSQAYVFGNEVGERVRSVHTAWTNACAAAGIVGIQLRDLRHEAASRFDESGMPINYVSTMLGHSNLTTTSRYLNIHRRGLHLAMNRYEQARLANFLQTDADPKSSSAPRHDEPASQKSLIQ